MVDETGKVLDTVVIYPTAPQNKVEEAKVILKKMIKKYNVSLISVGNGTASRESEQIIVELLKELQQPVPVSYTHLEEGSTDERIQVGPFLNKINYKKVGDTVVELDQYLSLIHISMMWCVWRRRTASLP